MTTIGESIPAASELVAQAQQRLAEEIAGWPPIESPLLWAQLRQLCQWQQPAASALPSLGAQVYYIRRAHLNGEQRLASDLFVVLLERIEQVCARWAAQSVAQTPNIPSAEQAGVGEELRQELTLRLWEELVRRTASSWELFFQRSLVFAQQHTATAVMQQRGYWLPKGVERPLRAVYWLMARLAEDTEADDNEQPAQTMQTMQTMQATVQAGDEQLFSGAELADLRALVLRLPAHQRTAIVLRYWQEASEAEIAQALGGITTRTVRNYLSRSYTLLRGWYEAPADNRESRVSL